MLDPMLPQRPAPRRTRQQARLLSNPLHILDDLSLSIVFQELDVASIFSCLAVSKSWRARTEFWIATRAGGSLKLDDVQDWDSASSENEGMFDRWIRLASTQLRRMSGKAKASIRVMAPYQPLMLWDFEHGYLVWVPTPPEWENSRPNIFPKYSNPKIRIRNYNPRNTLRSTTVDIRHIIRQHPSRGHANSYVRWYYMHDIQLHTSTTTKQTYVHILQSLASNIRPSGEIMISLIVNIKDPRRLLFYFEHGDSPRFVTLHDVYLYGLYNAYVTRTCISPPENNTQAESLTTNIPLSTTLKARMDYAGQLFHHPRLPLIFMLREDAFYVCCTNKEENHWGSVQLPKVKSIPGLSYTENGSDISFSQHLSGERVHITHQYSHTEQSGGFELPEADQKKPRTWVMHTYELSPTEPTFVVTQLFWDKTLKPNDRWRPLIAHQSTVIPDLRLCQIPDFMKQDDEWVATIKNFAKKRVDRYGVEIWEKDTEVVITGGAGEVVTGHRCFLMDREWHVSLDDSGFHVVSF